ncbi:MAG: hypothetical protein D6730_00270 [Bacteroidetes bacterium]|nr:MAG: hypothetical protein D6730_00270 [Bacteroidota bacterium]
MLYKPHLTRTFKLDNPDTSLQEFMQFIFDWIPLIVVQDEQLDEQQIEAANVLCEAIDAHPEQRVLVVEKGGVMEVMAPQLRSMTASAGKNLEEVQAFSLAKGSVIPAQTIGKGELGLFTIKQAFQQAVLQLS